MSYLLPPQIAEQYKTSLKTVYNYLSKYPSQIRIKKEFWKKYVNVEDFEKCFTKDIQNLIGNNSENSSTKRFWNRIEEIEVVASKDFQSYKDASKQGSSYADNWQLSGEVWTFESRLQKLQTELQSKSEKEEQLTKYTLTLQDQVSKYALLLSDEKAEKKSLFEKFVGLQSELQTKTETFWQQRTKLAQRLYLFIGLSIALTVAVFALLLPYLKIF